MPDWVKLLLVVGAIALVFMIKFSGVLLPDPKYDYTREDCPNRGKYPQRGDWLNPARFYVRNEYSPDDYDGTPATSVYCGGCGYMADVGSCNNLALTFTPLTDAFKHP